jgi:hypothetical protein
MWTIWKRKEECSSFEQFISKSSFEPYFVHKINPPFIDAKNAKNRFKEKTQFRHNGKSRKLPYRYFLAC